MEHKLKTHSVLQRVQKNWWQLKVEVLLESHINKTVKKKGIIEANKVLEQFKE